MQVIKINYNQCIQESAADAVKPARRESMQKLVPFVVETSYSLKKNLASGGIRTGDPEVKVYYLSWEFYRWTK